MFFWRKKKEIVEESKTEKIVLTASEQDELDNYIDGIKNDTDFDKILKDTEPKVVQKVEPKIEPNFIKKVEQKIVTKIDKNVSINCIEFNTIYTGEKYVLFEFSKDIWTHTYRISGKSKNGNYIFTPDITDDLKLSIEIIDYNALSMNIKFFDKFIHSIGKLVNAHQMMENFCQCLDGMESMELHLTSGDKIVKIGNKYITIEKFDSIACEIYLTINLEDTNLETVKRFLKIYEDAANKIKTNSQPIDNVVEPKVEQKGEPKVEQKVVKTIENYFSDLDLLDTLPFLLPMDFLYETYPKNWNWKNRRITETEQIAKFDENFKANISKYVTEVKTSDKILINKLFYYITICKLHSIQITHSGKIYNLCYGDGGIIISEISTVIEFKFLKNSKNIEILKSLRQFGDIEKVEIVLCTTDNRADSNAIIEIDLKDVLIIDLKTDDIIFSIDCKNRLEKQLRTYKTERKQYNTYIDYMSDMLNTTITKMENCEIRSIQLNATDKSNLNRIRFYPDLEYQNLKISFDYVKEKSLKIDIKFYDAGIKTEINQYVSALHFLELFKEEIGNLQTIEIHPTNGEPIYITKDKIKIENIDNNKCELILNLDLSDNTEYVLKFGEYYFYHFKWEDPTGGTDFRQEAIYGTDLIRATKYTKTRFVETFKNGVNKNWKLVRYEDAKKQEESFDKIETQPVKPIVIDKPIIKKSTLIKTIAVDNIVEIVFFTNSGENFKVPIYQPYVNYEIDAASKELNLSFWIQNDYKSYGNYISAKLANSFDIKLVCKSGKIYTILGKQISNFKLRSLRDILTIKDFEI